MSSSSTTPPCQRCGDVGTRATAVPYGGELGEQIREQICQSCWQRWQEEEVRIINELRLNFMKPESQEILTTKLREFLGLEQPA